MRSARRIVAPERAGSSPPSKGAAEAWTLFWAEQSPGSRCMARSPGICELVDAHWRKFGSALSPETRVIDLGCGAGAVARALHAAEPRLQVTGIDIAQIPPSTEPGFELQSNVPMESLPFPDGSFGAAVSQFGYEYGDRASVAGEMARVLAPRAPFSLLIHHSDGPIVDDMRRHRRAIEALCGLHVQSAFFSGKANDLAERLAILRRDCPHPILDQAELGLQAHIRQEEIGRLQVWRAVADALAPELVMLDSLDLCCAEAKGIGHIVSPLMREFEVAQPSVLLTKAAEPIAWAIQGTRR